MTNRDSRSNITVIWSGHVLCKKRIFSLQFRSILASQNNQIALDTLGPDSKKDWYVILICDICWITLAFLCRNHKIVNGWQKKRWEY